MSRIPDTPILDESLPVTVSTDLIDDVLLPDEELGMAVRIIASPDWLAAYAGSDKAAAKLPSVMEFLNQHGYSDE